MAEQDTRVQERGVDYTEMQDHEQSAEGTGLYTEPATVFNSSYDNKTTKIKNYRTWQPSRDGNDVTQSYTTGY